MRDWLKRLNEFLPGFKEMIENREWLQLLVLYLLPECVILYSRIA